MLIGLLIDLLADTLNVFVPRIGVDVLAGVDADIVAAVVVDLEFIVTRVTLEDALGCC